MKSSPQDRHYLEKEADAFHKRNHTNADTSVLRPYKDRIRERLARGGVTAPKRMVEFGCSYGDLLNHFAVETGTESFGIEPSADAVALGASAFGERVTLRQGTIADNALASDPSFDGTFDLAVVDDVFCWVSRETLFQSIANIDRLLCDGGHLYIQEFLPLHQSRNPNHHVEGGGVFCYKPRGPHLAMFTASGAYEIVYQEISIDRQDAYVTKGDRPAFESRWSNVVLRKSIGDYFE